MSSETLALVLTIDVVLLAVCSLLWLVTRSSIFGGYVYVHFLVIKVIFKLIGAIILGILGGFALHAVFGKPWSETLSPPKIGQGSGAAPRLKGEDE